MGWYSPVTAPCAAALMLNAAAGQANLRRHAINIQGSRPLTVKESKQVLRVSAG